ncbi:MAG: ABC transporter substrate-binding protein [Lentisphaeria bacterium]|nr:ABC transporter substrate-binding protein [Lentisphaeria bacterium]
MKTVLTSILLAVFLTGTAQIVSEDGEKIVYRQSNQETVTLKKHPKRTVVGYGSLAKVWDLAGGRAVGVPKLREKDALPESMKNLPMIGLPTVPNPEKIALVEPDLVLLSSKLTRHYAVASLMRQSGVDAVCVTYNNYDDFHALLDLFCRLNGNRIEQMPAAAKVTSDVAEICRSVKGRKAPRCAVIFASASGFSLESDRTNTGLMVKMLGAENILKKSERPRMNFSYEQLLVDDPDVMFIIMMGSHDMLREKFRREFMEQPAWRELKAAKSGRVHFLPTELFLYLPGPDYPAAFRHLKQLLYPEPAKP